MAGRAKSRKKAPQRAVAEETRKRLLAAGRRAFAAKGLGGTNLRDDILAPAKVSAGSFYHQFADKAELLLEILDVDGAGVREQVEKAPAPSGNDPTRGVRDAFAVYFDMADRNPWFVKIYIREYYSDDARVRRKIREHNASTIRNVTGNLTRLNARTGLTIDAELGGLLISNLAISVVNYYLGLPARERPAMRERLLAGMVDLLLGGIAAVRHHDEPAGDDV
jgi:AcrR family transcriptional regulator